jgi:hypothetical protein
MGIVVEACPVTLRVAELAGEDVGAERIVLREFCKLASNLAHLPRVVGEEAAAALERTRDPSRRVVSPPGVINSRKRQAVPEDDKMSVDLAPGRKRLRAR